MKTLKRAWDTAVSGLLDLRKQARQLVLAKSRSVR